MALPEGVNRRYAVGFGLLLAIIWLWVAIDRPYSLHHKYASDSNIADLKVPVPSSAPQAPDVFHDAEVDSDMIRAMCGGTVWNSSLVFMCDNAAGTVANVRNSILVCVRHAITVGANLILPRILNPDGEHEVGMTMLYWSTHPFDFMFDTEHFVNSLYHSCPEMKIYGSKKDVPFPDNYVHPPVITIIPEKIGIQDGESWHTAFYRLVSDMISPTEDTLPIVIEMARPKPLYDISNDGPAFVRDFGNILQFRSDVRELANKSLMKLSDTYKLRFNPTLPTQLIDFFGVHLLTEEETPLGCNENWPCIDRDFGLYGPEAKGYLEQATAANATTIYLSSHRHDEIERFTKDAAALGIKVHSKFDLLQGAEKVVLDKLTRDQQQLIDYLVLLKAKQFAGIGHSSFSWNVAIKRHALAGGEQFTIGSHIFEDSFSKLWGKMDSNSPLFYNMWP